MLKTVVFLSCVLIVWSQEDLKTEESLNRPLLKPSGKPIQSSDGGSPAVEESRPQIDYISSDTQDEVKPEYISNTQQNTQQNTEQRPIVGYVNRRPATPDYINTYPNIPGYPSYIYRDLPKVSYVIPQRGYQTAYQHIRNTGQVQLPDVQQTTYPIQQTLQQTYPVQQTIQQTYPLQQTLQRTYPLQQTYYPYQQTQYQYQYNYPQYLSRHLSHYIQPYQPYHYSYLPLIPLKKKK